MMNFYKRMQINNVVLIALGITSVGCTNNSANVDPNHTTSNRIMNKTVQNLQPAQGMFVNTLTAASTQCWKSSNTTVINPSQSAQFYYLYNDTSSSQYLNVSASAKATFGKFKIGGSVAKTSAQASRATGAEWINSFNYTITTTTNTQELTPAGESYVNAMNANPGPQTFSDMLTNCGSSIVTTTYSGQSVQFNMDLDFSSASTKTDSTAKLKASYLGLGKMSEAIDSENAQASHSISVSAGITQYGGNPGQGTSLAANMPSYNECTTNESGDLTQACFDAESQFNAFISSEAYQDQLTANNPNNAIIQYPDTANFPTVGIEESVLAQYESFVVHNINNEANLNNMWFASSVLAQALKSYATGPTNNAIQQQIQLDYINATKNTTALENILSAECMSGVCSDASVASYKAQPISVLGISFANLLQTTFTTLYNALLFSCAADSVTINFDNTIKSVQISSNTTSNNFTATGSAANIPGLCSGTNFTNGTIVGYVVLAALEESDPAAYVPFILNRDPIAPAFKLSQNEGPTTQVYYGSGISTFYTPNGTNGGINATLQGALSTAISVNTLDFKMTAGPGYSNGYTVLPYGMSPESSSSTLALSFSAHTESGAKCETDYCQSVESADPTIIPAI